MTLVPEGTPGSAVVAVKRVDELSFYNLGLFKVAEHVGLTPPRALAMIKYLALQEDPDCYKQFVIGKTKHSRYSQKAIAKIQEALEWVTIEEVWESHGSAALARRRRRNAARTSNGAAVNPIRLRR